MNQWQPAPEYGPAGLTRQDGPLTSHVGEDDTGLFYWIVHRRRAQSDELYELASRHKFKNRRTAIRNHKRWFKNTANHTRIRS